MGFHKQLRLPDANYEVSRCKAPSLRTLVRVAKLIVKARVNRLVMILKRGKNPLSNTRQDKRSYSALASQISRGVKTVYLVIFHPSNSLKIGIWSLGHELVRNAPGAPGIKVDRIWIRDITADRKRKDYYDSLEQMDKRLYIYLLVA